MEKTHVYKAVSDEKSPGFSEKSWETFWWFPYGTFDEKVSHNFPENFSGKFSCREFFRKCLEISEKFPDRICWKSFPQYFKKFYISRHKHFSERCCQCICFTHYKKKICITTYIYVFVLRAVKYSTHLAYTGVVGIPYTHDSNIFVLHITAPR